MHTERSLACAPRTGQGFLAEPGVTPHGTAFDVLHRVLHSNSRRSGDSRQSGAGEPKHQLLPGVGTGMKRHLETRNLGHDGRPAVAES